MSFLLALIISAASGFVALSYEIVWYRVHSFASASSPATFGLLLGQYLLGLALGSFAARILCKDHQATFQPSALRALGYFVFFANLLSFLVVPGVALRSASATPGPSSLLLVALAAGAMGASLPLVSHFGIAPDDRAGARLSYLYLANIIGSVAGSLVTGFVLFDYLSLAKVGCVLATVGFLLAGFIFAASGAAARSPMSIVGLSVIAASLLLASPQLHDGLYEKLLWGEQWQQHGRLARVVENRHGVIAVDRESVVYGGGAYDGRFSVDLANDISGLIRVFSLASLHAAPKRVLVVGVASGSWTQVLAHLPGVERVQAVEINPGYLPLIAERREVRSLLTNSKVTIDIDDGRRWLRKHPEERFDLIVMNTTHHFRAHATNLLSREFLELARPHLLPGGILFYNATGSTDVVKTALAVYPHVLRVRNHVAVSDAPIEPNRQRWEAALRRWTIDGSPVLDLANPAHEARLGRILAFVDTVSLPPTPDGLEARESLLRTHEGGSIITDDNMRCEWWPPPEPSFPNPAH